uniref:Ionotropic glutamate receptor C-terminal domain-containing protein n=1 Tax=Timema poppense TaxID=170557 RepID=A0A7R9CZW6_TIMPO|nr:unnamed protein product [Timema poppensis]
MLQETLAIPKAEFLTTSRNDDVALKEGLTPPAKVLETMGVGGFSELLSDARYCLFVRRPTTHHFNWSGLLEPFSTTLWIVAVLVVCFLSTVYGTVHHIQQLRGAEKPLQFSWLHMVGVVCQQSHVESPNSVTCRLIFSVMYIMCQVLLAAYSASLVSSLTIVNEEATFNTFQDLIQDKSYMVGVTENSPEKSFFMDTSNHVMRSIYQVMLTSPDNFPDMTRDGLQRACELKFAFFAPEVHGMNLLNSVTCSLKLLPNTCIKSSLSIPLQKNSPYKTSITDKLLMMRQSGLLNRLEKNLFMTTKEEISTWTSVQMNHVLPIMTILISGTMLAVMMAALEKLVYFRKHKSDVTVSNSIHQ